MSTNILFPVIIMASAVMAFVFARNVALGLRTGAIWAKGHRYYRSENPILFWITFGIYGFVTALCIGLMAIGIYALVAL
jgi:hypothetical protein